MVYKSCTSWEVLEVGDSGNLSSLCYINLKTVIISEISPGYFYAYMHQTGGPGECIPGLPYLM